MPCCAPSSRRLASATGTASTAVRAGCVASLPFALLWVLLEPLVMSAARESLLAVAGASPWVVVDATAMSCWP
ncbi:hypothetical protein D3C81_2013730 [compost metagenome]